jgi:DNA-binding MarR family transcriptional regulator
MGSTDRDALRAWQLLMRFFYAQREHLPSRSEALGLSAAQCHLLHVIEPGQPVPMSRLAGVLKCDPSNVTGLIDRLESRGLVQRRPSREDRRVKVVELTRTGSRLRMQLLHRVTASPLPLARLSAAEQRALVRILERLVDERSR